MPLATVDDVRRARRILLHGVTGSGKSTAAQALGEVLGLPVHLSDEEFGWLPGWVQRPRDDMRRLAAVAAAKPEWVFDTAYSAFRDLVEPKAEVIIGLDYPRWLSLGRLIRRTLSRVITQQEMCNGNRENWRAIFSKESIILWHFKTFRKKRDAMRSWAARSDGAPVLLLKHPREFSALMQELRLA
ncbi:MAG: adenylate kinase [Propionibacteriaceae bacterium]|nr:adenylate kinase [Propionibacteriaceae bacterium]